MNNKQHTFNNLVPRTEAIDLMINSMHILLSIGNTNIYQLPSKVIEYISLGKPVLHFAEIPNDPMYKFEKNKGYGTKEHMDAIKTFGITKQHRKSFEPIKSMIENNHEAN